MPTKVLIVEDESIIALDLQRRLVNLGYEVPRIAANHDQTMAAVRDLEPDVVLMDINIAGHIDGIETAAKIKMPVIYLTAYSENKTLERAKQTRPYGFLIKPFSERELHAAIQIALERYSYEKRLKDNEIQMATSYSKLALANMELKAQANRLLLENQRLDISLDSEGGGVITTDAIGNITYLNQKAEQMTGWTLVQAYGKPISKVVVFVNDQSERFDASIMEQIAFASINIGSDADYMLLNSEGKSIPIEHSLQLMRDLENRAVGAILVFHETTKESALMPDAAT